MNQQSRRNSLHLPSLVSFSGRSQFDTHLTDQPRNCPMLMLIRSLKSDNSGVTMIEYALIGALVSVVAITLLTAMGTTVSKLFSTVNNALTTA
jgi:pilus assembly protein Flp/PilA